MSFTNPTALRLGMVGTLVGKRYRVAGRIVMGMDDGGETYYWNEFNLVNTEGESATLVYEETERGGEWRIFTLFEPQSPLIVQEAATKRIGDSVNLEGRPIPVTLVDESRVYQIEGEAPEGVEVGDIAHYFNAGADNQMTVVSWTGDEIEFYRGLNLPSGVVASAFNLQSAAPSGGIQNANDVGSSSSSWIVKAVAVFLGVVILIVCYSSCRSTRSRTGIVKTSAPASPLTVTSTGILNGKSYRIRTHSVVEIAQVGLIRDQHEYDLVDKEGNGALLIYGSKVGARDWLFLTPMQPLTPLTPSEAAAKLTGETVNLDGSVARITDLFRSTTRQVESLEQPAQTNSSVLYGFSGTSGSDVLLARWNETGIAIHEGRVLSANQVTSAFSRAQK